MNQVTIYIDKRELNSQVPKELEKLGCVLEYRILEISDYVLSDRICIERKTPDDFFNSLFGEGRKLFGQLSDLKNSYEVPILIFEGSESELFTTRNVNPKAIQGILNAIAMMRIPILYSVNPAGTANILFSIANKEQNEEHRSISLHGKRSHMSPNDALIYTVSSMAGCDVGTDKARALLERFGSIERIAYSTVDQLKEVDGIGKKTAERIVEFFTRIYEKK